MGLVPGEVLAGTSSQVVREIGAGGMGVVYEVEHVRLRKRYVAKVIHDSIRGDETAPMRMEREARVLAEINHPNVVQVHDVGTTPDGTSYFVMEKLEGHDLRFAMKNGVLSASRAVSICVDVLDALDHVHRRGIVHRDIKPENIFLAQSPTGVTTKVLDFGIVHIFDGERASQARITKTGGFVGTLYYAAPEQLQGSAVGPANDVYACGLVLYEMLAGRGPFDDDPGVGLSRCFKPAPRLPTSDRITSTLADAVARALEQDPTKRPPAGALATTLREALAHLTTDPGPAPVVRADVDHLLGAINVAPSIALTAPPATPVMKGAPSAKATAPLSTTFHGPAEPSNAAIAYAATLGSAGASVPAGPNVDTASGVASSVEPSLAPRGSRLAIAAALAAAVAVLGIVVTAGVTLLRSHTPNEATRAVSAPPPVTAAETVTTPEPAAPAETTTAEATTAEPKPAVAPPAASSSAKPAAAPPRPGGGPAPAAAKPRGNAEKDGYMKSDDL